MFYRIKNNKIYDWADYKYAEDCLSTDICEQKEFEKNKEFFLVENGNLKLIPDYKEKIQLKRETEFKDLFFKTSLGWIRREVKLKDGSIKDFLSDLLLHIKAGMDLGQEVNIITYNQPDFLNELSPEYLISLQERKVATTDFIKECLVQTVNDFGI